VGAVRGTRLRRGFRPKDGSIGSKLRSPQENIEQPRPLEILEPAKRAHQFGCSLRAFCEEAIFGRGRGGIGRIRVGKLQRLAMLQPVVAVRDEVMQTVLAVQ